MQSRFFSICESCWFAVCLFVLDVTTTFLQDSDLQHGDNAHIITNKRKKIIILIYHKVVSTNASRFVTRLVYMHTQKPDKDKLQEWTEHWGTDHWKFRSSRDNQKIIITSFEHLKKCIDFQN